MAESVGNQTSVGVTLVTQALLHVFREEWSEAAVLIARSWTDYHRAGNHWASNQMASLVAITLDALGDDFANAWAMPDSTSAPPRVGQWTTTNSRPTSRPDSSR